MSEPKYVNIAASVKCFSLFIDRFYVGQNVYETSSKGVPPNGQKDWNAAVQSWYNEVKDFNKNNVSPYQ